LRARAQALLVGGLGRVRGQVERGLVVLIEGLPPARRPGRIQALQAPGRHEARGAPPARARRAHTRRGSLVGRARALPLTRPGPGTAGGRLADAGGGSAAAGSALPARAADGLRRFAPPARASAASAACRSSRRASLTSATPAGAGGPCFLRLRGLPAAAAAAPATSPAALSSTAAAVSQLASLLLAAPARAPGAHGAPPPRAAANAAS